MDKYKHFYIWELAALFSLCACLLTGLWAQGRQSSVADSLLRLHVLAVSDEPYEQAVKLRVRDAVLQYLAPKLSGVENAVRAEAILSASLDEIRTAAESAAEGREVYVVLGDERYPTREYDGFTLPAGHYRSLRVVLGEGKGQNWWCVVFPPVCLSAAQRDAVRPAMRPEDYALITQEEGWQLKFRIVELWGKLVESLEF